MSPVFKILASRTLIVYYFLELCHTKHSLISGGANFEFIFSMVFLANKRKSDLLFQHLELLYFRWNLNFNKKLKKINSVLFTPSSMFILFTMFKDETLLNWYIIFSENGNSIYLKFYQILKMFEKINLALKAATFIC